MRIRRIALAGAFLASAAALAWACGPATVEAIFVFRTHPEFPRRNFVAGKLGIVRSSYDVPYLAIAWRHMSGNALDATEREQAIDLFNDEGTADWDDSTRDWIDNWKKTRALVRPPRKAGEIEPWAFKPETNLHGLNCASDAFRMASHTLRERIREFGAGNPAVSEWAVAQDRVFENCQKDSGLPSAAKTSAPPVIRKDRDYQIAASHFYALRHAEAETRFRTIAADSSSPWQLISRYLVVRTLLRAGKPADALNEARAILQNPALDAIHGMTYRALDRARALSDREHYFRSIERSLATGGRPRSYREDLWVYVRELRERLKTDSKPPGELTRWIWYLRREGKASPDERESVVREWRNAKSTPWLIAALSLASAGDPAVEELQREAAKIPAGHAARLTATYHRLRLTAANPSTRAAAASELDQLLAARDLGPSARNLLLELRMRAQPSWLGFLRFAPRRPSGFVIGEFLDREGPLLADVHEVTPWLSARLERFDDDAAEILNKQAPLRLWRQAAASPSLPGHMRGMVALSGLTRALLLDRDADVKGFAADIAAVRPDLRARAQAVAASANGEQLRFAAAFLLMQAPESRPKVESAIPRQSADGQIDNYRDNWWIRERPSHPDQQAPAPGWMPSASFLSPADRKTGESEADRIQAAPDAARLLGGIALEFVRKHPSDPRAPEALHGVVRMYRYTNSGEEARKIQEDAFRLLHSRYKSSPWRAKTPYYY